MKICSFLRVTLGLNKNSRGNIPWLVDERTNVFAAMQADRRGWFD
jgi:hypothetical protein